MTPLLYDELVPFYHLLDPVEDHADEAAEFGDVLLQASDGSRSLLELGSGAGHGAHYVKDRFDATTLVDLSQPMLERSKTLNPECRHHYGDMRSVRLGELFDCVLIHDAIAYMASEQDLAAVMTTVFAHLKLGGAALLVPDCVRESFCDYYEDHAGDDTERSLRCLTWSYDPDPSDDTHLTDFAFLLREDGDVRAVHDRHTYGLFATDTWMRLGREAGFEMNRIQRPLPDEYRDSAYTDQMFLCRKG